MNADCGCDSQSTGRGALVQLIPTTTDAAAWRPARPHARAAFEPAIVFWVQACTLAPGHFRKGFDF